MLSLSQQCSCYNHALSGTVAIVTKLLLVERFEARSADEAVQCVCLVSTACVVNMFFCFAVIEIPVIHHTVHIRFRFCAVLKRDHIVHLKDGSCITWNVFNLFSFALCTAKDFNVLHGLPCIPCIHPSGCAQISHVNTFLCLVIILFFLVYAGILNGHDLKVFIPNKKKNIYKVHLHVFSFFLSC